MGQTLNLGRRIELIPMDAHFHDISIGLYRQHTDKGPAFRVHTYSHRDEAANRIAYVVSAMCVLGGMASAPDGLLRFPCRQDHELAVRRVFLEACKLPTGTELKPRPLSILDKKSGLNITVHSRGAGIYQVAADGEGDKAERISFIAGGLIKLGQMADQSMDTMAFSCGHAHDAVVGLLLVRAPNVRAVLREQEMTASRGVLAAPSQQK